MDEARQLSVRGIAKEFPADGTVTRVLDDVTLDVYQGEFLVILGPGRCGKSTLLNIIAGVLEPSGGSIEFPAAGPDGGRPRIGMVYQRICLMPWLTVMKNVAFIMKIDGVPKAERSMIARRYIEMVRLNGFENHYPHQLSGGMKQRVGIARAYAGRPHILLMDEPYGQLDAQTRYSMQEEIIKIYGQDKTTIVFVTSNLEEALVLGDRIVLLSAAPARVKGVYDIGLTRPRDMMDPAFMDLRNEIFENMDLALESGGTA